MCMLIIFAIFLMQKYLKLPRFIFDWLVFCLIFVDTHDFEKTCFLNCQRKENEANCFFHFEVLS